MDQRAAARAQVKRARAKQLAPDEFNSGTFTISNLGNFGADSFDAILPPGERFCMHRYWYGGSKRRVRLGVIHPDWEALEYRARRAVELAHGDSERLLCIECSRAAVLLAFVSTTERVSVLSVGIMEQHWNSRGIIQARWAAANRL